MKLTQGLEYGTFRTNDSEKKKKENLSLFVIYYSIFFISLSSKIQFFAS